MGHTSTDRGKKVGMKDAKQIYKLTIRCVRFDYVPCHGNKNDNHRMKNHALAARENSQFSLS